MNGKDSYANVDWRETFPKLVGPMAVLEESVNQEPDPEKRRKMLFALGNIKGTLQKNALINRVKANHA